MKTNFLPLCIIISFVLNAQTSAPVAINRTPSPHMRVNNAQVQQLKRSGVAYRQNWQNIVLDYDAVDEIQTVNNGGIYERFIWELNTRHNPNDTSVFALTWAAVRFDTLYDANTLTGYPHNSTNLFLDSVNVLFTHENITGTQDTIQISVYPWMGAAGIQVNAQEEIINPTIFDTLIITTTSLTPGASQAGVLTVYPNLQLNYPDNRYVVGVHFYGDTLNTFTILAGFNDFCAGACFATTSIFELNSLWRMIAWAGQNNVTGINAIAFDCNQNGQVGEPAECEEYPIQNLGISCFLTTDSILPCPAITVTTQVANTTTCGNCDGSIQLSPTGGNPPYLYEWSTGSTTNNMLDSLCAGTYSYTVTDFNNCSATGTAAVNSDSSDIVISTVATAIDCNNPFGTITATVIGGTPPYIYDWFDGTSDTTYSATLAHDYDSAGIKVVSVTDSLSCYQSAFDTVADLHPQIELAQFIRPVCTAANGKLKITVNSGAPPFNFTWSNGAITDSIENLVAGIYTVTVIDNSGCEDSRSFTLASSNGGVGFYVFLNPVDANCGNTGSISATTYGGVAPFSFAWNTGDTTQVLNNLGAGIYSLTVTDANGCARTGSRTLYSDCKNVISGIIFDDANGNCIIDTGEALIPNVVITASGGTRDYYGYTNTSGEYAILIADSGTFSLSASSGAGNGCETYAVCDKTDPIQFPTVGDTSADNNFTFISLSGHDLTVLAGWGQANPGFQVAFWIYYANEAQTPYTAQADVSFVYDPMLSYLNSTPPADVHDTASNSLTWYVTNVPQQINSNNTNRIVIYFQVPVNIPATELLQSHFYIEPSEDDCDITDNYFFAEPRVLGSYDPNEKEVSPAGDILETDSLLTYTIHFQNTGTDTTHFVILKDTLSHYLNAATVQNRAFSHPYSEFSVSDDGVLTWYFNPIYLVDSLTNEEESKGFVTFTVKKRNNIMLGTVIENRAGIYFDYNAPIITNTVQSTLSEPDWIFSPSGNDVTVRAVPNPFSDVTRVMVDGVIGTFDFLLYDLFGKEQRWIVSVEKNSLEVQRKNLSAGIYFYRIVTSGKTVAAGRLMIQ